MKIDLFRIIDTPDATLGIVFINGVFSVCTLEDVGRTVKIPKETRIPSGTFELGLRGYGQHHNRYAQRFPFHVGMIEILDVPNFTNILFHIGNTHADTAGCILVGISFNIALTPTQLFKSPTHLLKSELGYIRFYKAISTALLAEEDVKLQIYDSVYNLNKVTS